MKMKKIASLILAGCMMMVGSAPAFAADAGTVQPAAHAGETVVCQVVPDSGEPYTVEVAIPAGATRAEERAMVDAAVYSDNRTRSVMRAGPFTELSYMENVEILASGERKVGGGTLGETYLTLTVVFENVTAGSNTSTLSVRLKNESSGQTNTKQISVPSSTYFTYFLYGNNSNVALTKNSKISVYGRTNAGYLDADSCTVNVSPYEY